MNEVISLFVPGRLCLFGEHSDWAGLQRIINSNIVPGMAIVTGIEQGIYADVEKSDIFMMRNESQELQEIWSDFECNMQPGELKKIANSGGYFSYVAGVASYIRDLYHVGGLKVTITKMTLPINSGLSSSAAICVLVARAFNLIYKLNLNTMGEMNIAFQGEQRTPSRCGRLDQACAFGINPVCMHFDGNEISVDQLIVKEELHWVFAHLRVVKDTIRILSDLNKCYPFAGNEMERNVQMALGDDNQDLVGKAVECIGNGDKVGLGQLMIQAQRIFDEKVAPASPEQLTAPVLHKVLEDQTVKALTLGGKGVGSQGDGSVQFLAKNCECQDELIHYLSSIGLSPYKLTISPKYRIRKAVIPVAGYGTRLYPATRGMKKEFLPIIDVDGLAKPVILIILEQLHRSGIEEICLVVGDEEEKTFYQNYFRKRLPVEHREKLSPQMRSYEDRILEIGEKLSYKVQTERMGFGHAVYQCRDFCGNDPALLLLGDTIYSSNIPKTCSSQLIEAYERIGMPLVAVHEIPLEQVVHYGVIAGNWENSTQTHLQTTMLTEKPTIEYAEDFLGVKTNSKEKAYYSVFGQYVLTPEIFQELENNIVNGKTHNGEYYLTDALEAVRRKSGLMGVVLDGKMYDIGNAQTYRETMHSFR